MQSSSPLESALFCLIVVVLFGLLQFTRENWITVNIYVRCYYIKLVWWLKKVLKIKSEVQDD